MLVSTMQKLMTKYGRAAHYCLFVRRRIILSKCGRAVWLLVNLNKIVGFHTF